MYILSIYYIYIYIYLLSVVEPLVFIICSVCLFVDNPLKFFL